MYCKTCGAEMNDNQIVCLKCGCGVGTGTKYCANCGGELMPNAIACMKCGVAVDYGVSSTQKKANAIANGKFDGWCPADKDKTVAILLAFFLGGIGIHNFYLGETKKGVFKLCLCWCGVGGILALIDFVKMLIGSYKYNPDKLV